MIIDCHGHYTTAPRELDLYRERQLAHLKDPAQVPSPTSPALTDGELRASVENAQLKIQKERGTDLTIFSPQHPAWRITRAMPQRAKPGRKSVMT